MRLTSALYIRHLISKLHPPLPKSSRQSQQLLSVLQSSFSHQLDDFHPPPRAPESQDAARNAPHVSRNLSAEAANRHLDSILSHPLLGQDTSQRLSPALILFDDALFNNKVDLRVIQSCIETYTAQREPAATARGLGQRLSAWLDTAKGTDREKFLTDRLLMAKILPIMYRGAHEQVVWEWLKTLYEGDFRIDNLNTLYNPQSKRWLAVEDNFVALMIRESMRRRDLSGAAQEYIAALDYRASSGRGAWGHDDTVSRFPALTASWRTLLYGVLERRHRHGIANPLYLELLKERSGMVMDHFLSQSFLHLYQPMSPRSLSLESTLKSVKSSNAMLAWKTSAGKHLQRIVLISVLDAADLALNEGNQARSRFFLGFAEEHFPTFVSVSPATDTAARIEHAWEEVGVPSMSAITVGVA